MCVREVALDLDCFVLEDYEEECLFDSTLFPN
jgi:hypothetical protein